MKQSARTRLPAQPRLELLEERDCPAPLSVIGATGSPDTILAVKVVNDAADNTISTVQPFGNLTSIRVATGDFNGDGIDNEFAAMGRPGEVDRGRRPQQHPPAWAA